MRISTLIYLYNKKHQKQSETDSNNLSRSQAKLLLEKGYAYKDEEGKIWVIKDIYDNIYPWKGTKKK